MFPILNAPALNPPTVAGPIIHFFFLLASIAIILSFLSGMPSAITAIVLIVGVLRASIVVSNAERYEEKFTITSASG